MKTALYIFCYFIVLIYMPSDEYNNSLRAFCTVIFGLYVSYMYASTRFLNNLLSFKKNSHIYILAVLFSVGAFRSNLPEVSLFGEIAKIGQLYIFILGSILAVNSYLDQRMPIENMVFKFILLPFFLYYLLNLFLYFIGISFNTKGVIENSGQAVILSYFGIILDRVKFPLTTGLNSFAAVIGGVFTVALINIRFNSGFKLIPVIFTTMLLVILLMIDSRAAIIYPFLIAGFLFYVNKKPAILRALPIISIVGPLLIGSLLLLLSNIEFFQSMSRSSEDLSTGNSRSLIWGVAYSKLLGFDLNQLIGYGEFGHYASGASLEWASNFASFENSELMHPHNTILATIFDYGYLGFFIYIYILYRVINISLKDWNIYRKINYMIISYLIYFVFIGITESFFGYYYLNSYYLLFSFLIIQNCLHNRRDYINPIIVRDFTKKRISLPENENLVINN